MLPTQTANVICYETDPSSHQERRLMKTNSNCFNYSQNLVMSPRVAPCALTEHHAMMAYWGLEE